MKTFAISLLATLCAWIPANASEATDSVSTFTHLSTIVITESPEGLTVTDTDTLTGASRVLFNRTYAPNATVKSTQSRRRDVTYNLISFNNSRHFDISSGGLSVGLVNAMGQPAGNGLQWEKSFEVSWLQIAGVQYTTRFVDLSLGIGFTWRHFRMTGQNRMMADSEGNISTLPITETIEGGSSRILTANLDFPLLLHIKPYRKWKLSAGPVLNCTTHASLLTKYKMTPNISMEESTKDFRYRKMSVDLYGSVIYSDLGLYVRYSPQTVLTGTLSPQFHPLSVGVTLGF